MPKLTGKRVLVTGGAGFIGSHLVDRIIRESPGNLVVADNLFLGKESNVEQAKKDFHDLKLYRQDCTEYELMRRILVAEDIEVVFNLAVVPLPTSLERPRWTADVNFLSTTVLCDLCREGLFKTLIHFSSSEVYGTAQYTPMDEKHPLLPCTPYAASKAAGDHVVLSYQKTFGLDVAIVRPFNNFGPRQNEGDAAGIIPVLIQRALGGEPVVIFGDGEQTRDFIFVRETADAAVRVYEEPATRKRILNIASGEELSINRLVRAILEILDADVEIKHAAPRPGDVRRHCADVELAEQLISFRPGVAFDEGLVETVNWYKEMLTGE